MRACRGTLYFGARPAIVAIANPDGVAIVEELPAIDTVLGNGRKERPALLFAMKRGEREARYRALLKPGATLDVTGPATEFPAPMSAEKFRARVRRIRRESNIVFARYFLPLVLLAVLWMFGADWLGISGPRWEVAVSVLSVSRSPGSVTAGGSAR